MTCPWRWLVITDGTLSDAGIRNQVDLLSDHSGFCVTEWEPAITTLKGGGTWKDSSLANGRRLALNKKANVIETMTVEVRDADADTLIRDTQELRRLLEKARTYWTTNWQTEPVWLEAQGVGESNIRYTLIMDWMTPNDGNPYEQPFWQLVAKAGMDDFSLIMEREPFWRADVPGESTCVEITGSGISMTSVPFHAEYNATTSTISIPSNVLIDDLHAGDFSVDGWVRADSYGENTDARWADKTTSAAFGWTIRINPGAALGLEATVYAAAPSAVSASGTDDFTADGLDHHLAMTYNGTGTRLIRLWVDGIEVSYASQIAAGGAINTDVGRILYLGNRSANDRTWDGGLGWIRVSGGLRWTANFQDAIPPRCTLPAIAGGTIGQWIGFETVNPITNQQGAAAIDGAHANCTFEGCRNQVVGQTTETCTDINYIANKHNQANISHIFTWSAANGFSLNRMLTPTPWDLIDIAGAAPAVNDYVVFGIDTTLPNSGPFSSLVFDIGTAISGITADDWEYSTGGPGWANLAAEQDNTNQDGAMTGSAFDTTGVGSVHWEQPAAWATQAENGVTGYWIRVLVTAAPGAHVAPTQQLRSVYSIVWPYVTIDDAQVGGDVPALAESEATYQSLSGGDDISHVLTGLRSLSRGLDYSAYINLSDEQNNAGITIATFSATAIAARIQAPSGRAAFFNPGGVIGALTEQVRVTFSGALSIQYIGTYHAFCRLVQIGGSADDFTIQLRWNFGAEQLKDAISISAVNDFTIIDFGAVTIGGQNVLQTETFNSSWISLYMTNLNAAPGDAYIYDIILIPTDEWAIDNAYPGGSNERLDYGRKLDIDSVKYPKVPIRSLLREVSDDSITGIYNPITPQSAIVQANADQRLWFFVYGPSDVLRLAEIHQSYSITMLEIQRYFSMRGSR